MKSSIINNAQIQLDPSRDTYGSRVALAFGNENGSCPFYVRKECYHCDIGEGEGEFTSEMNIDRLNFLKSYFGETLLNVNHLVIFNSGSTLNQREMSRNTLGKILDYASSLEDCKVVSLDSREMYVTKKSLDYFVGFLREDQQLRVILGVESQNDEVRIGKLNKRMTKQGIEKVFSVAGKYEGKVGIDINIVFQPPKLTGGEAIQEVVATLQYGLELGKQYGVQVDFNFHPYYPSKKSSNMYPNHLRADLQDVKEALTRMKAEIRGSFAQIYVGWDDEGHDQQLIVSDRELDESFVVFDKFNITQDIKDLE
tara:strand:+ start:145 stop:1077 length:933 start_codon:yes stop_codon:yes gene_type:complete